MTKKVQIHLKNIVTIGLKFEKVADNAARFECNVILKMFKKRGWCSKSRLLYVKKVKKGLDNNGKFELNTSQFYVFQEKKIKITLIKSKIPVQLKIQNHHSNKSKVPV